jgi:hypothetical protein
MLWGRYSQKYYKLNYDEYIIKIFTIIFAII